MGLLWAVYRARREIRAVIAGKLISRGEGWEPISRDRVPIDVKTPFQPSRGIGAWGRSFEGGRAARSSTSGTVATALDAAPRQTENTGCLRHPITAKIGRKWLLSYYVPQEPRNAEDSLFSSVFLGCQGAFLNQRMDRGAKAARCGLRAGVENDPWQIGNRVSRRNASGVSNPIGDVADQDRPELENARFRPQRNRPEQRMRSHGE